MIRERLFIPSLLLLVAILAGCGDSGDFFLADNQASVPTGSVRLQLFRPRADIRTQLVPVGATRVRVTGVDAGNTVVFGPTTLVIADELVVRNVPVTVVRLDGEYLQNNTVVGRFSEAVTIPENGEVTVVAPNLLPAVPGNLNQFASGPYFGVSGLIKFDIQSGNTTGRETSVRGDFELDGEGNIAQGGSFTVVRNDGTSSGTHGGGSYNLNTDLSIDASLNTEIGVVSLDGGVVVGGASEGKPANFAAGTFSADGGATNGLGYLVRRTTGVDESALDGDYLLSGLFTTSEQIRFGFDGAIRFDGNGNILAGGLICATLSDRFSGPRLFPIQPGSGYTVDDDGDFRATLEFGDFTCLLVGAVGPDGQVIATAEIPCEAGGIGRLDKTSPQVAARGVPVRAQESVVGSHVALFTKLTRDAITDEQMESAIGLGNAVIEPNGDFMLTLFVRGNGEPVFTRGSGQISLEGEGGTGELTFDGDSEPSAVGVAVLNDGSVLLTIVDDDGCFFRATLMDPSKTPEPEPDPGSTLPDLSDEFEVLESSQGPGVLSLHLKQRLTSNLNITAFQIKAEDNPELNFSALTDAGASILDPQTLEEKDQFDSISYGPDGALFAKGDPIEPLDDVFLDLEFLGSGFEDFSEVEDIRIIVREDGDFTFAGTVNLPIGPALPGTGQ